MHIIWISSFQTGSPPFFFLFCCKFLISLQQTSSFPSKHFFFFFFESYDQGSISWTFLEQCVLVFLGEPTRLRIPELEFVAPWGGLRTPSLLLAIFISVFPFCLYLSFFSCLSCGEDDEDKSCNTFLVVVKRMWIMLLIAIFISLILRIMMLQYSFFLCLS